LKKFEGKIAVIKSIHLGCIDTSIIQSGRMEDAKSHSEAQTFFCRRVCSRQVIR
jgi:hypothetical protein